MKYQQFINCGLLLLCLFFQVQVFSQCSYFAYESFSYAPNTAIFGQQAGSGWESPWTVQNNETSVPGYHSEANSLSYSNLQTIGNQMSIGSNFINAGRNLDRSSNGPFSAYLNNSGFIGADGTSLWMSALVQKNEANDNWVFIELNGDPIPWVVQAETDPYSDPHMGVGYYGTDSDVGGERRWSLRIWDSVYPMSIPVVENQAIFLVLNITFDLNSGHQIDVYIDPVLGAVPPSPTYSHTYNGDLWFSGIVVHSSDNNEGALDEVRLADSYQCVAPDNTVSVNLPPTANFISSTTDGISPVQTTLDPSNSVDTDGTIVSYEWDFNDGSPVVTQTTAAPLDHTFMATGVFDIELKVTDDDGANNTFVQEIIVRESDGSFTCQVGANLEQSATCSQAIGQIRIENTYNGLIQNHQLYDDAMQAIPTEGYNLYSNLETGNYTLIASGAYGCIDTLSLFVPVDSSTCDGWVPDLCRMQSGMNLNFPTFWTSERPFKNLFRFNNGFNTFDETIPWVGTGVEDILPVDAAGYPLEIPWTDGMGMAHIVKTVITDNGYYPTGTLVVLYDGTGDIQCTAPMTNITEGRFEITVTNNSAILFDIYESQIGNHIRNIRVLRPEDEFDDLTAEPFHQNFLDRLSPFKSIRFMNWMGTNDSPVSDWSERNLPTYFNQGLDGSPSGVSYEYLIELCNTLDADPWICIPHLANDDYVIQLSHLFRDNLDPELNVYIEYSNEVWNWGFPQSHWVTDNGPANISYPRRYAQRASRLINIFKDEFGNREDQVKRVLGTQLTGNWVTNEILSQANQDDYDYLSPSSYFGMDAGLCENALDANSTPEDVIDCTRQSFYSQYGSWKRDYQNAKMYGKEVITYEAGNHMTNFNPNVPYLQAMQDAQTHPGIYDLYQEVIDSLHRLDSRMNMFFVLAARLGNSVDTFGHLDDIDQEAPYTSTAPKYQVLLDNIDSNCESIDMGCARIYVNQSATGSNDGTSWTNAYLDLNDALDNLTDCGSEIWIAAGTYYTAEAGSGRGSQFDISQDVSIYGGFVGGETSLDSRDIVENEVILSGDIDQDGTWLANSFHTVKVKDAIVTLDGLTIKDGAADNLNSFGRARGGAVFVNEANLSLIDCTFSNNKAIWGGAIFGTLSVIEITRCNITENEADYGSAIYHSNETNLYVNETRITDNNALVRCAIEVNNSNYTRIINTVVANNIAQNANAIGIISTNRDVQCDIANSTIIGGTKNRALITLQIGYGDQLDMNIYNSIIAHQNLSFNKNIVVFNRNILNLATEHCYIQGASVSGTTTGNLYSSTAGELTMNSDYSLDPCSIGVDDGGYNSYFYPSLDINGNPRPFGPIDIGAYEDQNGCSSSRQNNEEELDITIAPNPTSNIFKITGVSGDYQIQILTTTGKVCQSYKGTDTSIIDISTLPSGMYFISLQQNGERLGTVQKIMKM